MDGELEQHAKRELARISGDINAFIKAQKERHDDLVKRVDKNQAITLDVAQKMYRSGGGDPGSYSGNVTTPAAEIVDTLMKSSNFEALTRGEVKSLAVRVPNIMAATIVTTAPLVDTERDREILRPLERRLTVRDLLPVLPTTSGSVEYTKEPSYTNAADIQTAEGAAKAESELTFELVSATVRTIAHWIPASRQVLDDRAELMNYIENRLLYGLKFREELQLLLGSGAGVNLHGIYTQATAYNRSGGGVKLDYLRKSITQLQLVDATPTGILLNPEDWEDVELQKATDGQYITMTANNNGREVAWRLPVVVTNAMPAANFLTAILLVEPRSEIGRKPASRYHVSIRISS